MVRHYVLLLIVGFLSCAAPDKENQVENEPGSELKNGPDYYREDHRPQFHFSPETSWMNDPNGMVYYDGEYHLFYQYYPDSIVWGPMHWGHAVSKDLVSWEHLPIAIAPDSLGYIFSGSAVIDEQNTSGLGTIDNPPMVAIFTYHNPKYAKEGKVDVEKQAIAYSLDRGRNWVKYAQNPVLANPGIRDFRDPKVFWHEATAKWIMVLAAQDHINIYSSRNLIQWTTESEFGKNSGAHGGVWECPDLFPLPNPDGGTKWVLLVSINPGGPQGGSATQYFVGDFDGSSFKDDETGSKWIDYGPDNYAGVTWANIPNSDGRRIFLGWMSNWNYAQVVPTNEWRSAMTIPRELSLFNHTSGLRLASNPVEESVLLRYRGTDFKRSLVNGELDWSHLLRSRDILLDMEFIVTNIQQSGSWKIVLSNDKSEVLEFGYDDQSNMIYIDRTKTGNVSFNSDFRKRYEMRRPNKYEQMPVRVLLDRSSIELFTDKGESVMTSTFFPDQKFNKLIFKAPDQAVLMEGVIYQLQSVWQ